MTAFLHLIKQHLSNDIQKTIDDSVSADASLTNQAAALFGFGLDPAISEKKRADLRALIVNIRTFSPKEDDKNNFEALRALINTSYIQILTLSKSPTAVEHALQNLDGLLLSAYTLLKDKDLVDTPLNDDPLNKFKYYVTSYHLYNVIKQYEASLLAQVLTNRELTTEKDRLLQTKLVGCVTQIGALDMGKAAYRESKKQVILTQIALSVAENQDLVHKFGARDTGYLGECLINAKQAVESDMPLQDYLEAKENDDTVDRSTVVIPAAGAPTAAVDTAPPLPVSTTAAPLQATEPLPPAADTELSTEAATPLTLTADDGAAVEAPLPPPPVSTTVAPLQATEPLPLATDTEPSTEAAATLLTLTADDGAAVDAPLPLPPVSTTVAEGLPRPDPTPAVDVERSPPSAVEDAPVKRAMASAAHLTLITDSSDHVDIAPITAAAAKAAPVLAQVGLLSAPKRGKGGGQPNAATASSLAKK